MPELPEVETIAAGLARCLTGLSMESAILKRRDILRRGSLGTGVLKGRSVDAVERVGKNIAVRLSQGCTLVVNLGMTGRLIYISPGEGADGFDKKHMHAIFRLTGGAYLKYYDARRFGFMYITRGNDIALELGIGKDPFEMNGRELAEILSRRSAPIKSVLLNQNLISGLGNIYVDETLFDAGIHPLARSMEAAQSASLILSSARRILNEAIRARGTTIRDYRSIDGSPGGFQRSLKVYGRDGNKCGRCGARIVKIRVAGRGTHFCPACQPFMKD